MTNFQVIHFATHSDSNGVLLSNGELLTAQDVAQLARITEAMCIFFNSCLSGRLAAYAVRHGVRFCVYTNVNLIDDEAWKAPAAFYDSLQNGHSNDVVGAYIVSDNGDGTYGLDVSPEWLVEIQRLAAQGIKFLQNSGNARLIMILFAVFVLLSSSLLTVVINYLAGK